MKEKTGWPGMDIYPWITSLFKDFGALTELTSERGHLRHLKHPPLYFLPNTAQPTRPL